MEKRHPRNPTNRIRTVKKYALSEIEISLTNRFRQKTPENLGKQTLENKAPVKSGEKEYENSQTSLLH